MNHFQHIIKTHGNAAGYYQVGSHRYAHKISALLKSAETDIHPTWHFHSDVFSKIDWTQDIPVPLTMLYQQRALQLRQKYDYLVLSFSGGSDSWTALKAFHDAGTYVDEIFFLWPLKRMENRYTVSTDTAETNIFSEWDLTIKPMLKEIERTMPKTKITVYDWSDDVERITYTSDFAYQVDDLWSLARPLRNQVHLHPTTNSSQVGKVGVIFGVDKPQMTYRDGNVYCYFLDKLCHTKSLPDELGWGTEFFYWTPDVPEVTVAQARVIFNFLKQNTEHLALIDCKIPYSRDRKSIWDSLVRTLIYSEYSRLGFFQSEKPRSINNLAMDLLVFRDQDSWLIQGWRSEVKNLFTGIPEKFIEHRPSGPELVGFVDGMYNLGGIPNEI